MRKLFFRTLPLWVRGGLSGLLVYVLLVLPFIMVIFLVNLVPPVIEYFNFYFIYPLFLIPNISGILIASTITKSEAFGAVILLSIPINLAIYFLAGTLTSFLVKKRYQIFILVFIIMLAVSIPLFFLKSKDNINFNHDIYHYSTLQFNDSNFTIVRLKPENIHKLAFYYKNDRGEKFIDINHLKNWLESKNRKLVFATNGGIFSKMYEPLGLYVENGMTISNINSTTGEGNFYIQPNGIFLIRESRAEIIETAKYEDSVGTLFAIQSGPMLVIDNKVNLSFNENSENKYTRSGVGTDAAGNVIFAISNQPVSFYEFSTFFKEELGCRNALYLDGAISEMYVPGRREMTDEKFSVIIGISEKQ